VGRIGFYGLLIVDRSPRMSGRKEDSKCGLQLGSRYSLPVTESLGQELVEDID